MPPTNQQGKQKMETISVSYNYSDYLRVRFKILTRIEWAFFVAPNSFVCRSQNRNRNRNRSRSRNRNVEQDDDDGDYKRQSWAQIVPFFARAKRKSVQPETELASSGTNLNIRI